MSRPGSSATPEQLTAFAELFRGNPAAHYVRTADGAYQAVERGLTVADFERQLAGIPPSVLVIPVNRAGMSYVDVIDVDRHGDADPPVDYPALAIQVTRLGLPLVVLRSKNGRGAWLALFLKEHDGCPASLVRRLLERYRQVLGLTGEIEIFPKQEKLEQKPDGAWEKGNGVNIGYFGSERPAFGKNGKELDLAGFLALAQERQSFGSLLASRDLPAAPSASGSAPAAESVILLATASLTRTVTPG